MDEKLKIDYAEFETAISEMRSAHTIFSTLSEKGFSEETGYLEEMNSDFVEKLGRILEMTKKWKFDRITEKIDEYIAEAETICQDIRKKEEALAGGKQGIPWEN